MIRITNLKETVRGLLASKQRTILALVGIVIGIGSVICMVSVGRIVQEEALSQFREMGTDILTIRMNDFISNPRGGKTIVGFALADLLALPASSPAIMSIAPYLTTNGEITYGGKKLSALEVVGATQALAPLNKLTTREGRLLSDLDEGSTFCYIGDEVRTKLLQSGAPGVVGEQLKIGGKIFTVIGAINKMPESGMRRFRVNGSVYIHITTAQRMNRDAGITTVLARVMPGVSNGVAQRQVKEYFGHKTKTREVEVVSPEELIAGMEKQMRLFTLLLGAIGSIALIMGGIGIMNVMLVSVSERRKEIGIRRALGARRGDIKTQFLAEAIFLSFIGGLLGILLGISASYLIAHFAKWQFLLSYVAIFLGGGVASVVGIFFGFYPAHQASKLDPIVALRGE